MILKIERYTEQQHWWMLDNIRKVSVSKLLLQRLDLWHNCNIQIFDMPNSDCTCKGSGDECSNCKYYLTLICRDKEGNEFAVAFDTVAYLLNDEGKTIEKIVANYKE